MRKWRKQYQNRDINGLDVSIRKIMNDDNLSRFITIFNYT